MLKKIYAVLILGLCFTNGHAQTDANYSMYMRSKLYYNPAYAGMEEGLSLSGANRTRMKGISNAPSSVYFSVSAPVNLLKGAVGMKFVTDKYGLFNDLSANLIYSHQMRIWRGRLSLGMQLGMMQHAFDASKANTATDAGSDNYHNGTDPLIPGGDENAMTMDLGIGGYYEDDQLYLGVSGLHLMESESKLGTVSPTYIPRTFFVTAGYLLETNMRKFDIRPSTMIKTDLSSAQIDLNVLGVYEKKFWGGMGYRINEALIFMIGIDLANGLSVGYSYDIGVSQLLSYADGAQELTVTYRLNLDFKKNRNKYKSIRIL